ncbi:MAG: HAMP domain-containing protein [Chloroflexi bacterium]|nr:HAMP domain-containing protein [Chloroflexota bacterium]
MLRDLRTQILLWTILPFTVLLVAVAMLGVNGHQMAMRDLVAERDSALAATASDRLSDLLGDHAAHLASLDPDQPGSWDTRAFEGGIALLDAERHIVRAEPSVGVWASRTRYVPASGAFSVPFRENGLWHVLVVRPLVDGQLLIGMLTLPQLARVVPQGTAYLVDSHGHTILHPDEARVGEDLGGHEGIREVMRGEAGMAFHRDLNAAEQVVGYAPVAGTGWGLLIEEPWDHVVTPMFQFAVLLPLLFAGVAIVTLGGLYFGVRNVVRPLQALAQVANRIAFGNYRAAEQSVGGIREIEDLRETLNAMAHEVEAGRAATQNYIAAITRSQEDERKRLARELHDDTIQTIIALQQRATMTRRVLDRDPAAAAVRLDELTGMLGGALDSVRRFVRDLRPTYLDMLGLIPALETLARDTGAQLVCEGDERRLDGERELVLFRIVQEALQNTRKHAQAAHASVTLAFGADGVQATIEDDGKGFDAPDEPAVFARAGHFGLMGMHERAQLFGGHVYVKSVSGEGTKVVVFLPLPPDPRESAPPG